MHYSGKLGLTKKTLLWCTLVADELSMLDLVNITDLIQKLNLGKALTQIQGRHNVRHHA